MNSLLTKYFLIILFFVSFGSSCFYLGIWWGSRKESDDVWATYGGNGRVTKEDVWGDIQDDVSTLERNIYSIKTKAIKDFVVKKVTSESSASGVEIMKAFDDSIYQLSENEMEKNFLDFLKSRGLEKQKMSFSELTNARENFKIYARVEVEKKKASQIYESSNVKILIPLPGSSH